MENFSRDGNIRPLCLPPEKSVCRSRRNSEYWTWNNGLVPNWERSTYFKAVYCNRASFTYMQNVCVGCSVMSDSATPWTVAHQALLPMGFSRHEHWSELPRSPPGDLSDPGTEPRSPALHVDSLPSEPPGRPKNTGVGSLVPSPGNLPDPGIEAALQADSSPAKLPRKPYGNPYNVLGSFYWTIVALQYC